MHPRATRIDVLSCLERALACPQRSQHKTSASALAETLRARGPVLMLVDNMEQAPMDVDAVCALFRWHHRHNGCSPPGRPGANAERIIHVGPAVDDSVNFPTSRAGSSPDSPDLAQMVAPLEGNPWRCCLQPPNYARQSQPWPNTSPTLRSRGQTKTMPSSGRGSLALLSDTERNVLGQCAWFDGGFTVSQH